MARPNAQRTAPGAHPPVVGRGPGRGPGRMMHEKVRAKDTQGTLVRLWSYLRRQRAILVAVSLLVIASSTLSLIGPYLLGVAVDDYVIPGDLPGLARISLLMLVVYLLAAAFTWFQQYLIAAAAQRTVRDIRNDLFAKLQTLSLRYFDQHPHGDVMSRLTNDVDNINMVLSESVIQLTSGAITLVGAVALMLWLSPMLALTTIIVIPAIMLVLTRWIAGQTRVGFRRQQSSLGALNGYIEETITGQRVVKAFGREQDALAKFELANRELQKAATHAQIYAGFMGPSMNVVNNVGLAIVVGSGGWMALQGMISIGVITSFISYMRQFARPLNELANLYNTIQAAVAGAERVFEVIDETPEIVDAPNAVPLANIRGEVVMENVDFAYEAGVPVLKRVSLRAKPGEVIALVGPTGAGKTTIVNLLTRFYDSDGGRITLDGHDIRQVRKDDLRRQLGIVLQDTYLFTGTVMDNIRYGRLDASDDEVIAAAKLANADPFIRHLPHGYATQLSERASNLSQGQRQLLAISRAVLADPRILILDEATSSVDTRTEQHLQEAMLRLMAGRTSFVIAHRLSTIRNADQIVVINHGTVIEQGTHAELLAQGGFYHHLYTSQFRAGIPTQADSEDAALGALVPD